MLPCWPQIEVFPSGLKPVFLNSILALEMIENSQSETRVRCVSPGAHVAGVMDAMNLGGCGFELC